ncbi:hypothetical protein MKY37_19355 [Psychrobacillus sp. FSL K6-2836]|uniref:hypothetical protein n=1 Tax=Psychrobacillus sp. FSL K6-2836 TaxID=2921548 RepID=UPI0030F93A57
MQRIFRDKKIEKGRTRKKIEDKIAENEGRGWKQISDIKEDYGKFQVLLKFEVDRNYEV